jgi:hypothetical protein
MIDDAVGYVQMGIPVILLHGISSEGACGCARGHECTSAGKHPVSTGWQNQGDDPYAVEQAFAAYRDRHGFDANVGLRLRAVGLAVLDVDSAAGEEALAELVYADDLEEMPMAHTARGTHYFVVTDRAPGAIAPGLELKSENVVAPPSVTQSGEVRAWETGRELESLDRVPALPDSVLEAMSARRPSSGGSGGHATPYLLGLVTEDMIERMLVRKGLTAEEFIEKLEAVL